MHTDICNCVPKDICRSSREGRSTPHVICDLVLSSVTLPKSLNKSLMRAHSPGKVWLSPQHVMQSSDPDPWASGIQEQGDKQAGNLPVGVWGRGALRTFTAIMCLRMSVRNSRGLGGGATQPRPNTKSCSVGIPPQRGRCVCTPRKISEIPFSSLRATI